MKCLLKKPGLHISLVLNIQTAFKILYSADFLHLLVELSRDKKINYTLHQIHISQYSSLFSKKSNYSFSYDYKTEILLLINKKCISEFNLHNMNIQCKYSI